MPSQLGYWNIRGLGQAIRNMLKYVGEDYEERSYEIGSAPEFNRDDWFKEKQTFDLKLPNLPYYINGDVKLTQSLAILRHLGRKYDLIATTEKEHQVQDMFEQQIVEFRTGFTIAFLSKEHKQKFKEFFEGQAPKFELISKHLGNGKWMLGEKLTYLDFLVCDFFIFVDYFGGRKSIEALSNLKDYIKRFQKLPNLKEYFESEEFKSLPTVLPEGYYEKLR